MARLTLQHCVNALQEHAVIAYPTEAVFGLGCDPDSEKAVCDLLSLKQRPVEKGLILVAANYSQLLSYINDAALTSAQREKMFSVWPGPITWVLPAQSSAPAWLTGHFHSLAVRVSAHPDVQSLCLELGKPLVSTSANRHGREPCRSCEAVFEQFGADFPVLNGNIGKEKNPCEIRDLLTDKIFRHG